MTDGNAAEAKPSTATGRVPTWFIVVAVLALLWNLLGLMAFVAQAMITPEAIAALPEEQRAAYESGLPVWVWIAFACAVFGGTIGCIGLILKKRWALPMFVISLLGVAAQNTHTWFLSDMVAVMGAQAVIMPALVLVVAIALLWFARRSAANGWLR